MHQNRWRLGIRRRPRWGSLQRSPRTLVVRAEGREWGGDEEVEGREGSGVCDIAPLPQLPGYPTDAKTN